MLLLYGNPLPIGVFSGFLLYVVVRGGFADILRVAMVPDGDS